MPFPRQEGTVAKDFALSKAGPAQTHTQTAISGFHRLVLPKSRMFLVLPGVVRVLIWRSAYEVDRSLLCIPFSYKLFVRDWTTSLGSDFALYLQLSVDPLIYVVTPHLGQARKTFRSTSTKKSLECL
jgi:hypothetical protein